jgi:hypothetical protein
VGAANTIFLTPVDQGQVSNAMVPGVSVCFGNFKKSTFMGHHDQQRLMATECVVVSSELLKYVVESPERLIRLDELAFERS